jgi:hypothetical protein
MTDKVDLKRVHREAYAAKQKPGLVYIPEIAYLMIDGEGNPNTAAAYKEAVGALYSLAYTAKFAAKAKGEDFVVMPLQGLWWVPDMPGFTMEDKEAWLWTMMIAVPFGADLLEEARAAAAEKAPSPALQHIRLEMLTEGRSAQVLHLGPYAEEKPTIDGLHAFIEEQGLTRRRKHHEIYLSDPGRTAPERLKTIIRQPVA